MADLKSISEIADCMECKWSSEARDAVARAQRHANRTGHTVSVERCVGGRVYPNTGKRAGQERGE